jgi:hypothetical protein
LGIHGNQLTKFAADKELKRKMCTPPEVIWKTLIFFFEMCIAKAIQEQFVGDESQALSQAVCSVTKGAPILVLDLQ